MERGRRNYESEVCELLRRRLIDERARPIGLDPAHDFHAEDVRLERGADSDQVVLLFRACGKKRLLGYREAVVHFSEMALQGSLEYEPPEMRYQGVLIDLAEDLLTGSISEPDRDGISWLQPRRRRGKMVVNELT